MLREERIELRVSKEEKQKIMNDTLENDMSMTDIYWDVLMLKDAV